MSRASTPPHRPTRNTPPRATPSSSRATRSGSPSATATAISAGPCSPSAGGQARTRCEISDGIVRSSATNRSMSYWEMMEGRRFAIAVDVNASSPKHRRTYRKIGRRVVAIDLADLVQGTAPFVHDMQHAGHAARPPRAAAELSRAHRGDRRRRFMTGWTARIWCATAASSRSRRRTSTRRSGLPSASPRRSAGRRNVGSTRATCTSVW